MKKWIAIVLCLCLVLGLSACGSKSASDSSYMREESYASNSASYTGAKPAADSPMEPSYSEAEEYYDGEWSEKPDDAGFGSNVVQVDYDKIIYTASTNVQTLDFEKSLEQVSALVEQFGGYIQSSSVTGTDISRKYKSYRSASFTLRIPTNRFAGFQNALETVGNVTYFNQDQENISVQYYDVQSRLTTYRTEEERLLAMLEKCETVDDMITIESRLSEVRYDIESLTSTLRCYDQLVAYSTVYLYVNEVEEYIEETPIVRGYWEQIGEGFVRSLKGVGTFFKNLFKNFLIALPYLVLIAFFIAIAVLILRPIVRKRRERRAQWPDAEKQKKPKKSRKHRRQPEPPAPADDEQGPTQV